MDLSGILSAATDGRTEARSCRTLEFAMSRKGNDRDLAFPVAASSAIFAEYLRFFGRQMNANAELARKAAACRNITELTEALSVYWQTASTTFNTIWRRHTRELDHSLLRRPESLTTHRAREGAPSQDHQQEASRWQSPHRFIFEADEGQITFVNWAALVFFGILLRKGDPEVICNSSFLEFAARAREVTRILWRADYPGVCPTHPGSLGQLSHQCALPSPATGRAKRRAKDGRELCGMLQ